MRGHGLSVMPVTAGCRKDVERLLKKFKELLTVQYKPFAELFEKTQFATIFMGRLCAADVFEFSEKLLQIAISYALSCRVQKNAEYVNEDSPKNETISKDVAKFRDEMTLQERLFGIYLAYMLYFVQPDGFVAQIRVTPCQMNDLKEFVRERILPERHVDAYAALLKLENAGAFRIIAFEKDYNPELHRRYDHIKLDEGLTSENDIDDELGLLRSIGDDAVFTQLSILSEKYLQAKKAVKLPLEADVNLVKTNVADIYDCILKNAEDEAANAIANMKQQSPQKPDQIRSFIKEKAFKARVVQARHRRHRADPSAASNSEDDVNTAKQVSADVLLELKRRRKKCMDARVESSSINESQPTSTADDFPSSSKSEIVTVEDAQDDSSKARKSKKKKADDVDLFECLTSSNKRKEISSLKALERTLEKVKKAQAARIAE